MTDIGPEYMEPPRIDPISTASAAFHAFPAVVRGGFIGVDAFLSLSGYLITAAILRERDAGRCRSVVCRLPGSPPNLRAAESETANVPAR